MLFHSNATIDIERMVRTGGTEAPSSIKTNYGVYVNPRSENIQEARDGQGAYSQFMMLTDGTFSLLVGDKIIWGSRTFKVQGGENFDDLTGKHGQFLIVEEHDE